MALAFDRMTADEYLALADQLPRFSQLIDGEVVLTTPTVLHQHVVGGLYMALRMWIAAAPGRGQAGFDVDVVLDDRNVYAPDVWWYRQDRMPGLREDRLPAPPDLAVEVRSPSTWRYDTRVKKQVYERQGVPELWLVDTKRDRVLVFRRSSADAAEFDVAVELSAPGDGDSQLTSPLLPDFALDLRALFAR